jgi:hypothetical protein
VRKIPFRRPRCKWKEIIKMDFREIVCECGLGSYGSKSNDRLLWNRAMNF